MPELPEVEVLARHLQSTLPGRTIRKIDILRPKTCRPNTPEEFVRVLCHHRFVRVERRAKYLVFSLRTPRRRTVSLTILGHLGMTGRLFLLPKRAPLPKHTAAVLHLDQDRLIFQDMRYFGRLTLDTSSLGNLGPEPLEAEFTTRSLQQTLSRSRQPIKVCLLDQTRIAGLGNIYASEVLFRARIHPASPANQLQSDEITALRRSIRAVLRQAIAWGSTVPLNWAGEGSRDRLFYYGQSPDAPGTYEERLRVYARQGEPCACCRTPIQRIVQAARSTFLCPQCQTR